MSPSVSWPAIMSAAALLSTLWSHLPTASLTCIFKILTRAIKGR